MEKYTGVDNLEVMDCAKNYNQYLVDLVKLNLNLNSKVIDFGAGIGTFAEKISHFFPKVICVEPDHMMSEIIRQKKIDTYKSLFEIKEEKILSLYSFNVLEHIEDDQAIINDIYNFMPNGSRVLIYVPAFQALFSSMDEKVGHYRRYNKKSILKLLGNTKFRVLKFEYVDSLGFFITYLYKFFGSKKGDLSKGPVEIFDTYIFPISKVIDHITCKFFGKNLYVLLEK
jgi:SAM-dependent methyltransferase